MSNNQRIEQILNTHDTVRRALIFAPKPSENTPKLLAKLHQNTLKALTALIQKSNEEAFREGQLDCKAASDPRNHDHYKEALIEELEKVDDQLPNFWTGVKAEYTHEDCVKLANYVVNRIEELRQ